MKVRAAALATALVLAVASIAHAASRVVVVEDASRATRDATARLRAELSAAGFEVDGASEEASDLSVRLAREPGTKRTELTVNDRLTGKTLVRRVNADPERQPRLVAIRAVELVRASLLELTSPPHDEAPPVTPAMAAPPPPEVTKLVGPPPAPPPEAREQPAPIAPPRARRWIDRVSLDAGAAMLGSTEGLAPAFAPTLAASFPLGARLAIRPRLVGPAFRNGVTNGFGSADVRQEMATIELAWSPLDDATWAPFVALGGGAFHMHVEGSPTTSYPFLHPASDDVLAAAGSAGLGLAVSLSPWAAIVADARALVFAPHPVIAIGGQRAAATGGPALLGALSLSASF